MKKTGLILLIILAVMISLLPVSLADEGTELIALNVGKGDCLLLKAEGKAYLIDAGYEKNHNALMKMLETCSVEELDGVFLTHCDRDHYGGMEKLAQSGMKVKNWYASALYTDFDEANHPLVLAAAQRNERVTWLTAGEEISLENGAFIRVIGPVTLNESDENNNSLVLLVKTEDGTMLLTGDMKQEEEMSLLEAGNVEAADVLKVGYHGDSEASGEAFIQKVLPKTAVISTSTKERSKTPAESVLKRLNRVNAECLVTQDYERGIIVQLKDEIVSREALQFDGTDYSTFIRLAITVSEDILTVRNSASEDIDLSGWMIYSENGETCVFLPEGTVLPANGVFKIGTRATSKSVDLSLDMKRLWHKTEYDAACLYDLNGSAVAETDNHIAKQ